MHTFNPFKIRSTVYPVKALAILPNRDGLTARRPLNNIHMLKTNSLAIKGGDL
ncbi:MAG: hypothetical protein V4749_12820 [Pseudomonadota bacterium]